MMQRMEKRSPKMKSKMLGFAAIAMIVLLSVPSLTLGGSEDYLVPVTIKKVDKTEIKGYIILHHEEILRLGAEASLKKWEDPSKLLAFESMKFMEGGSEVCIWYLHGKEPLVGANFFSAKGIHFTVRASNLDLLPHYLHPGNVRWIKRTGRPEKIR
jgi:hypothetical protein